MVLLILKKLEAFWKINILYIVQGIWIIFRLELFFEIGYSENDLIKVDLYYTDDFILKKLKRIPFGWHLKMKLLQSN